MFGLADCNNFYVSCERVFNPSLNGLPVVVLSNNDGCIISRSNEAKALGIKMGEPVFKIRELVKKHNVRVFSSNFALYGDMSHRVMERLRIIFPGIEVYSIDEAFLNLCGMNKAEIITLAADATSTIKKETGIPVSIGISRTKTLAKIAAKLCKKYPALNNSCVMYEQKDIEKVLSKFPVEDIWGIGRQYSKMLQKNNIFTAGDFVRSDPSWIKSQMSIVGLKTFNELKGVPSFEFEDNSQDKKQICTSRSFATDLYEHEEVIMAVAKFAASCAQKLRKQKGVCSRALVFVLTNPFKDSAPHDYRSILINFENATDSTFEIVSMCTKAVANVLKSGYGYKKAGVILSEIGLKSETPGSLFCEKDFIAEGRLMKTLDEINDRYGRETLYPASQGVNKMRYNMNMLSPRYTTVWEDIIKVKI
jgi:DNA polymerase V